MLKKGASLIWVTRCLVFRHVRKYYEYSDLGGRVIRQCFKRFFALREAERGQPGFPASIYI